MRVFPGEVHVRAGASIEEGAGHYIVIFVNLCGGLEELVDNQKLLSL